MCYNEDVINMKKYLNKECLLWVIMFISLMILPLFIDIYTRGLIDINTYSFNTLRYRSLWIGFSLSWITFIFLVIYLIPKKYRIRVFTIINIILDILLFAQVSYTQQMGKYMVVSDLFVAGEGLQYIKSVFINMNFGMILTIVLNIIFLVILNYLNKKVILKKDKDKKIKPNKFIVGGLILGVLVFRLYSYLMLGSVVEDNSWKENYNAKNIYNNFTNPNTSMFVSGFYEYHFRAVYKYIYNLVTLDKTSLKSNIDKYNYIYGSLKKDNEYTGILKDKSVIFVMMESIDSWIVDEETMPTLKHLMDTGLNFTNRYSPFFNGGQTINSEFALNTGMYAISDKETIYDMEDMDYPYSLANMLKNDGYKVNSFHANSGSFYSRTDFHHRLGYDHHYSALDMQKAGLLDKNKNYFSDSTFIDDERLYDLFVDNNKFLSFMTTYSAHLEYTENNRVYKSIAHDLKNNGYMEEEYIYRVLAHDTDKFLAKLLSNLESEDKLDDVVIVLVADHYSYGYTDSDYVALRKETINDNKELQKTPLVIWSRDLPHQEIDTILDTADVLPTLLNMLGIDYNPNYYLGDDVFSDTHDDFIYFSDGTYIKSNSCSLSHEAILTKVNYKIYKNKAILLTNYYGK